MKTEDTKSIPVIKSLNEEKKLATFVVLEPQDEDTANTSDLHGDWYSAEEVEKACHAFNLHCRKSNIFHAMETNSFSFVESYILPLDAELNGQSIKKGTWLAVIKAHEDWIWDGIKDGTFNGLSIQCNALATEIED